MKKIELVLIFSFLVTCLGFFYPQFLPFLSEEQTIKLSIYMCYALLFLLFAFRGKTSEKLIFDNSFKIILYGMIFSVFMASTQHMQQSLGVSFMAVLPYFVPYSFYFLLKKSSLSKDQIVKLCLFIGIINVLLTFQLWALVPNQLFGSIRLNEDGRGTRIGIEGDIFKIFLLFYSLNEYKIRKNKYWLIVAICSFITVLLSLTRQVMAITLVLSVLFYLKKVKLYKKIIVLCGVFIFSIGIMQLPYFADLIEVSERQRQDSQGEENIRVTAAKFYLDENQVNTLTRLFGNGCYSYGNSKYGNEAYKQQMKTLCFPSDVGLVSFYYFFGVLGIGGILLILIKTIKLKLPPNECYMKYIIYYVMLASIASGPVLYTSQSVVFVVTCYLLAKVKLYEK